MVGVTWYEANAYCRWLQRHWSDLEEGEANPGCQPALVRLPAEAEWGRTAGGEQPQERYPWDAPGQATQEQSEILKRANMGENGISHTTPVGMYPEGQGKPFRLWDLAGNVWEWQANLFNKDHDFLALRGGSWRHYHQSARVAVRSTPLARSLYGTTTVFGCWPSPGTILFPEFLFSAFCSAAPHFGADALPPKGGELIRKKILRIAEFLVAGIQKSFLRSYPRNWHNSCTG